MLKAAEGSKHPGWCRTNLLLPPEFKRRRADEAPLEALAPPSDAPRFLAPAEAALESAPLTEAAVAAATQDKG